ncbi:uncharacterized protein B0H64DRAFT_392399 [Chaetomium fimeti]|uniref:Uncharacterized protein n=1 Tax=Chaetomium fimeti TaxID=1854472 RepID=A0AAE0LU23_9PEZI|nr:hypothetical protein B0H64DRAFT_392399 [Chaetomium fimeti]
MAGAGPPVPRIYRFMATGLGASMWFWVCRSSVGNSWEKRLTSCRYRSSTEPRKTVLPTNPTSRSIDEKQLTQPHRAGSPRLEAPLGALGAKSKRIDGGEVLLGGHCTYYHQYDALRETIYTTVLFVQL